MQSSSRNGLVHLRRRAETPRATFWWTLGVSIAVTVVLSFAIRLDVAVLVGIAVSGFVWPIVVGRHASSIHEWLALHEP